MEFTRFGKATLTGGTILAAIVSVAVIATTYRFDLQDWNAVCGDRVRLYDPSYSSILLQSGIPAKFPLFAEILILLTIPPLLTWSHFAHKATLIVLLMLCLVLAAIAGGEVSEQAYYGECYQGGGQNAPGEVSFLIFPAVIIAAVTNTIFVVADWVTALGILKRRIFRSR